MKAEQTKDVNIELKPALSYVDDLLNGWGWPGNIKSGFDFFADPKAFLNGLQDKLGESIPFLKKPTAKEDAPIPSTATPAPGTAESSTPDPKTATQH